MAGLGRKTWSAGEVATAANVQGYLQDQVVQVYAGTAARSSALGTAVSEGMVSYLSDTNALQYYSGSAWVDILAAAASVTTVSAAYTAVAADRKILANGTAAYTLTFPDLFSVGDSVEVYRDSSGTVTLAAGTGVTSWAGAGTAGTAVTFKIDQQYNGAAVTKVAANSYRVIGKITV
jgi:hypothetical protein